MPGVKHPYPVLIMEKHKNTPQLRFPYFEGEWKEMRLEKLFSEFQSGFGITSEYITEQGEYPVFGGNGLRGFTNKYSHDGFFLLIGRQGALCGNINRSYGKAYISEHAIACQANESSDTEWLAQRLDYYNLNRLSESSAQPGLSVKKLLRFKLIIPSLLEQQKIASFFTAIDQKISQLKQKKTLLEQYKKGVMQKIFSQEIRFKDENGQEFPKWERKKLGDVFAEITESVGDREVPTYSITAGIGFVSQKEKFGRDISGQQNHKYTIVDHEQFSYNKGNSKTYHYGCIYINDTGRQIAVPNVFISFKMIDNNMSSRFFFRLFESHYLDKELRRIISSSARMDGLLNVNKNWFFKLKIPCPTYFEQHKVGDFFYAMEGKINHIQKQIEKAEVWKKGLMQQMFV